MQPRRRTTSYCAASPWTHRCCEKASTRCPRRSTTRPRGHRSVSAASGLPHPTSSRGCTASRCRRRRFVTFTFFRHRRCRVQTTAVPVCCIQLFTLSLVSPCCIQCCKTAAVACGAPLQPENSFRPYEFINKMQTIKLLIDSPTLRGELF